MDTLDKSTTTEMSIETNRESTISPNGNHATPFTANGTTEAAARNGANPDHERDFTGASDPVRETQSQEDPEVTVERLLTNYLEDVRELGVVARVAVGTEPGRRGAYVWNVLAEDLSWGSTDFAPYHQLNRIGYELKRELSGIISVDVAHVNPSQLADFQKQCREQRVDLDFLPL